MGNVYRNHSPYYLAPLWFLSLPAEDDTQLSITFKLSYTKALPQPFNPSHCLNCSNIHRPPQNLSLVPCGTPNFSQCLPRHLNNPVKCFTLLPTISFLLTAELLLVIDQTTVYGRTASIVQLINAPTITIKISGRARFVSTTISLVVSLIFLEIEWKNQLHRIYGSESTVTQD